LRQRQGFAFRKALAQQPRATGAEERGVIHGMIFLYSLLFLYMGLYMLVLCAINSYSLLKGDDGRTIHDMQASLEALAAAQAYDASTVAVVASHALPSIADAIQLFRALADKPDSQPVGEYNGVSLPLGVSLFSGAVIVRDHLLGYEGHGQWVGKVVDGKAGKNSFQIRGKGRPRTHSRLFTVDVKHRSVIDGKPATLIDYSETDSMFFTTMREEVRCMTKDLCIGFSGFTYTNGVRNGSPFLLFRKGTEHHVERETDAPSTTRSTTASDTSKPRSEL